MQSFNENDKLQLEEISKKYKKLCELLNYEEVLVDKKLFLNFHKQKQLIEPIFIMYQDILSLTENLKNFEIELKNFNNDDKKLFVLEIENIKKDILKKEKDLAIQLNKFESKQENLTIEVIANKTENSLKILKLLKNGYNSFCVKNNLNIVNFNNENKIQINIFKNEIGLHSCLPNVNEDNCQVFVYNNKNKNFVFDEKDIIINTCRSSGAGGQHVNTTDSAIKVTHKETGLTAICQDERSQFQNKQKAIQRLKEKLEKYYLDISKKEIEKQKKEQLEKIKKKVIIKWYDFESNKITKFNKQIFLIKDFLAGDEI